MTTLAAVCAAPVAYAGAPPEDLVDWFRARSVPLDRLNAAYADPADKLDRVLSIASAIGEADSRVAELLRSIEAARPRAPLSVPDWLLDEQTPESVRAEISIAVASRWHAWGFYEEVLEWLDGVDARHAAEPTLVHYYRAVACHQLVDLDAAAENARRLLDADGEIALRHRAVAELILRDVKTADPKSAARLWRPMNDIRRRLTLSRAAEAEQALQQEVIDALDKLIEDAEKQRQQQQQQASAGGVPAPSTPMQDSRPSELKGPGEVDPRESTPGGDWGSLPPQERERVTQQIGRDYPAYYRDVIEAYFRSLAGEAPLDEVER